MSGGLPYVIRILVTAGDPDGVRVVEKSNWTGRGVVFSRPDLANAVAEGLDRPGVYVLIGDDPEEAFAQRVYVGQAENVAKRLGEHQGDDAKEFWTDTVVFVSAAESLNRAHILYLESRLVGLVHQVRRAAVANGNRTSEPSLTAADRAEAEGFLQEMLAIFPVLGVDAFDKPAEVSPEERRFYLDGRGGKGEAVERSDGFLVFAGATARAQETPSIGDSTRRLRQRLVASGLLVDKGSVLELTDDYLFRSPSAAAAVLQAGSANGRTEWHDAGGVTLKEHQARSAPS